MITIRLRPAIFAAVLSCLAAGPALAQSACKAPEPPAPLRGPSPKLPAFVPQYCMGLAGERAPACQTAMIKDAISTFRRQQGEWGTAAAYYANALDGWQKANAAYIDCERTRVRGL